MKPTDPHRKLIEGYRKKCPNGWATGPNDGYFFQRLPYHLQRAKLVTELNLLLLDLRWIEAKLHATDLTGLLSDFRLADSNPALNLVEETLRLSAHVTNEDHNQVAAQLSGRINVDDPALACLVAQINNSDQISGFIPLRTSFQQSGGPLVSSFSGHSGFISALAVEADGRLAASADDNTILIWETDTGRITQRLVGHSGVITALEFSTDGKRIISASKDSTLGVWDIADGRRLFTLREHSAPVIALATNAIDCRIVSLSEDATMRVWHSETGAPLRCMQTGSKNFTSLGLLKGGTQAVVGGIDAIAIWDIEQCRQITRLDTGGNVDAIAVSPQGNFVAAVVSKSLEHRIKVWNIESGQQVAQCGGRGSFYDDLVFSADGFFLIAASFPKPDSDQSARVWQAGPTPLKILRFTPPDGLKLAAELQGHIGGAWLLASAANRMVVLSYGHEKLIRVWDLDRATRSERRGLPEAALIEESAGQYGTLNISCVVIDTDCKIAVTASECGTICAWELKSGRLLRTINHWENENVRMSPPPCLAMVRGGETVIVSCADPKTHKSGLYELNWETGDVVRTLPVGIIPEDYGEEQPLISSMVLTPDGLLVASCFYDELLIWDLSCGERVALIRGENSPPLAPNLIHERYPIALFPDGRRLDDSRGGTRSVNCRLLI